MHGPIEDPAPVTASGHQSRFSPLHKESKFCGICHSKETFNVYCSLVYDQAKAAKDLRQCQECHMETIGQRAVAIGGKERTAHSHLFPGGRFKASWGKALDLSLNVEKTSPAEIQVRVTMRSKIPHNIPDGWPWGAKAVLEVSATKQDGTVLFKEEDEYKNIGISRKGESVGAAWLISSYSEKKSTAFKPFEVKEKAFRVSLRDNEGQEIEVHARLYSHHGLPTEFGKPQRGELMIETSKRVGPWCTDRTIE
jgi:hypothetical protein